MSPGAPALADPSAPPDETSLAALLGDSMPSYREALRGAAAAAPGFTAGWAYYRDGKAWLLKAASRGKTLFWLSAGKGSFRIAFYLGSGAQAAVEASGLPEEAKAAYRASEGKKIRALSLELSTEADLEAFRQALAIKLAG